MARLSGRNLAVTVIIVLALLIVAGFQVRGPLPDILLPAEVLFHPLGFPLTNTILTGWLTTTVLLILVYFATGFDGSRMRLVPSGVQNLMETSVELLFNFVTGIAGERNGRRFFPLVATIFLFVITNAWLALVPGFGTIGLVEAGHGHISFNETKVGGLTVGVVPPGGGQAEGKEEGHGLKGALVPFLRGANTDLNTTLGLALVAMFFVEFWGIRANGFFSYAGRFINIGRIFRGQIVSGILDLFIGLLETISEVARVISFTFRLFGNMFAGEVLLAVMVFLIPWVVVIPFYGLEIFVGFVQALVFASLTLVFSNMAVASHSEEHEGSGGERASH